MKKLDGSFDRYLMELEFDGSPFCGWQLQSEAAELKYPSLQGTLEKSFSTVLHLKNARILVQGCGRTDAGVHAKQFFAHVDLDSELLEKVGGAERLRHKMNSVLPDQVVLLGLTKVAFDFHALNNVKSKTYEYRLMQRRAKPVLERGYVYWMPHTVNEPLVLDWDLFERGLNKFVGEHDFMAFASKGSVVKSTVRKITSAELKFKTPRAGQKNISVRFTGEGFLKQQIRNMVGTLLELSQGRRSLMSLDDLLRDPVKMGGREASGFCVPPEGLYLIRVEY